MRKIALCYGLLMGLSSMAVAGPAEEGRQLVEQWASSFNEGNLDAIVGTYAPEAIVWGTVSRTRGSSPEDFRAYFNPVFNRKTKVELGEHTLRVIGDTVVDAGQYVFKTPLPDGTVRESPARYHFVAVRTPTGWKIIAHHSSLLPPPS